MWRHIFPLCWKRSRQPVSYPVFLLSMQEIIALPTDSTNSWRHMRPPAWLSLRFSLKGFVCAFAECWVKTMFCSRIFIGKWLTANVAAGKNVRGTQGSLKKLCESLNECEKSRKKAKWLGSREMFLKMQIQGNPKFNPFSRIRRFSSSKNIKRFFRILQRFQTLPRVGSRPLNKV